MQNPLQLNDEERHYKYFFGYLDKRDNCIALTCKLLLLIPLFPFVLIYALVEQCVIPLLKSFYLNALKPCCIRFFHCLGYIF